MKRKIAHFVKLSHSHTRRAEGDADGHHCTKSNSDEDPSF